MNLQNVWIEYAALMRVADLISEGDNLVSALRQTAEELKEYQDAHWHSKIVEFDLTNWVELGKPEKSNDD